MNNTTLFKPNRSPEGFINRNITPNLVFNSRNFIEQVRLVGLDEIPIFQKMINQHRYDYYRISKSNPTETDEIYDGFLEKYEIGSYQYALIGLGCFIEKTHHPMHMVILFMHREARIAVIFKRVDKPNWYFLTLFASKYMRAHEQLCRIVLGLVDWPAYILLWISEWLPGTDALTAYQKLRLIEGVKNSVKRIRENRVIL